MTSHDLESVALTLVAKGKGILAADETIPTLTKRFDTLGIQSTEQSAPTAKCLRPLAPPSSSAVSSCMTRRYV
jgi:fructose-bisphosphate aldolase class I